MPKLEYPVTVRLDEALYVPVYKEAVKNHESKLGVVIRKAIRQYLESNQDKGISYE